MQNIKIVKKEEVISHLQIRRIIGLIAITLPLVLVFGDSFITGVFRIEPSISDYYYNDMRNSYFGLLLCMAVFFLIYNYKSDNVVAKITGISILFDIFFPTSSPNEIVVLIHLVAAGTFLFLLGYFPLFVFTKFDKEKGKTPMKLIRNRVYRISGCVIFASFTVLIVYFIFNRTMGLNLEEYKFVFLVETVVLEVFGFAWLVKGGVFLKDN